MGSDSEPVIQYSMVWESSKRGYRVNTMLVISFTTHLYAALITAVAKFGACNSGAICLG